MSDFEARLASLVEDGTYKSRGEALRALIAAGDPEALAGSLLGDALKEHPEGVYIAPLLGVNFTKPWFVKIADGVAGASPALPNIANRPIAYAGQAAGVGMQGLMETFGTPMKLENITRPRPRLSWWRRAWMVIRGSR